MSRLTFRPGRIAVSYWLALVVAVGLAMALAPLLEPPHGPRPESAEVWEFFQSEAPRHGLDPVFAYAIAQAESGGDPWAFNRGARGLMQLRRPAWEQVSREPFRAAWDWRENARAGCAYLAWCRARLEAAGARPTTALLAASYTFGPGAVADAGHTIANLPRPRNALYRRLFAGEAAPAPPPRAPGK